ncbi:hypothetical protein OG728_38360 (plasmid) [Streptomyces microflavus]|uniref:hypothetical protein n=1 Tax=Streptomyces microflavus TaxID=1919 RepID=UPI002E10E71C|nr:hypothetical protein OG728_38360 [Streptomyces microflavus]
MTSTPAPASGAPESAGAALSVSAFNSGYKDDPRVTIAVHLATGSSLTVTGRLGDDHHKHVTPAEAPASLEWLTPAVATDPHAVTTVITMHGQPRPAAGHHIALPLDGTVTVHVCAVHVPGTQDPSEEVEHEDFDGRRRTHADHVIAHITLGHADAAELASAEDAPADSLPLTTGPCSEVEQRSPSGFRIAFDDDSIRLLDGLRELVMWSQQEWTEDPNVVFAILNAAMLGFTDGPDAVRARLLEEEDRDINELARALPAISTPAGWTEHGAYCRPFQCRCGCDQSQTCLDCHRCVCWRAQCCGQASADRARTSSRRTALRALLGPMTPAMLTELRQTAADAEESALRAAVARRVRLLTSAEGLRWTRVVFDARDSKFGMGHADYRVHDVTLHDNDTSRIVDLDDDTLCAVLGTLAELLRPEEGADLSVDLDDIPGQLCEPNT